VQVQEGDLNRFKAKIFKALSDPVRLEILEFLRDGEKCVCVITPHVNLIQPLVSRHLKILKDSGLVSVRKEGSNRLYCIADKRVFEVTSALTPDMIDSLTKRIIEQITAK
jgi:DNA-binding transcriptional ArsR family regulator